MVGRAIECIRERLGLEARALSEAVTISFYSKPRFHWLKRGPMGGKVLCCEARYSHRRWAPCPFVNDPGDRCSTNWAGTPASYVVLPCSPSTSLG